MAKKFSVQLHADQFDRLARPTQPVAAVAELIWNGLDAEADKVEVRLERTDSDAVAAVVVQDWGHGMNAQEIDRDFIQVGGSWKKLHPMSKNGLRPMHGRQGEGRFRAFAVGHSVVWETTADAVTGDRFQHTIQSRMGTGEFEVSDPSPAATEPTGTVVRIDSPREYINRLTADGALLELQVQFASFLLKYPRVEITFDNHLLDPRTLIAGEMNDQLVVELGFEGPPPALRIIEWSNQAAKIRPTILLCTADGIVLHEVADRTPTLKDFPYTAYVLWDGFKDHIGALALADLDHEVLAPVLQAARDRVKRRLDEVDNLRRSRIIEEWQADDIYPVMVAPKTVSEKRTRDLFNLVAVTAAPAVSKNRKQAKLTLRLMKEALEESPQALHRVLKEVLDLTPEQVSDFDELLKQTTLGDIIKTTRIVADRLSFLSDLEHMLFERSNRRRLLERKELHKILDTRSWIFGDEYTMVVSDRGLTRVLQEHRHLLDAGKGETSPVRGPDGNPLIVDLFLSAVAAGLQQKRHLVVELKRPRVELGIPEISQIETYALTVMDEPQFRAEGLWWDFWLIGDDMDRHAKIKTQQKDRLPGVTTEGDNYRVTVRTWAQILEENRRRLHFYKDHLNFKSPNDEALAATVSKYLTTDLAKTLQERKSG